MKNLLKNTKIRTRIFFLLGLTLILMSLVTATGLWQINVIGREMTTLLNLDISLTNTLGKITFNSMEQRIHFEHAVQHGMYIAQDATVKDYYETDRKNFLKHGQTFTQEIAKGRELLEQLSGVHRASNKQDKVLKIDYELRNISKEHSDYQFEAKRVLNLLSQGKRGQAQTAIEKIKEKHRQDEHRRPLENLLLAIEDFIHNSIANTQKNKQTAMVGMLLFSALILIFGLGFGIFISRGISRPLQLAVNVANQIAAGERDLTIEGTAKDETGQLLKTMKQMSYSIKGKEESLQAANQQLQAGQQQLEAANQQLKSEIADRKRVEQLLDYKRNLLRTLVDTLPDPVFAKDTNGVFTFNNKSCARALGAESPKDVVGKTDFDFLPREQAEKHHEVEQQIIRTGKPSLNYEIRFDNKSDNTTKWFSSSKAPWLDDNGNMIGIVGLRNDITNRKEAEEALENEKNKVQRYIDAAQVMLLVLDRDQKVRLINRKGCEILGHKKKDIVGKDWCDNFVPQSHKEEIRPLLAELLNGKVELPHYYENPILTESNQSRLVAWRNTMVYNKEGQVEVLLSSGEDITERKQAEENLKTAYKKLETTNREMKEMQSQLVQNEKLASIGQLAAGVAHEMNNPVGFVASNFQTLEKYVSKFRSIMDMYDDLLGQVETLGNEKIKKMTDGIRESWDDAKMDFILEDIQELFNDSKEGLDRITGIIQNLRDFSRIDQPTDLSEYALNEGIKTTLVVARNELKYNCDVKTEFSEVPYILCNSGQINQVLLNVLVNAVQAIKSQEREESGTITIRTSASETHVVCEISDDGPGIHPDKLPNVFDPFFTTKPVGKGTGLGLSVSHDIVVNKHKGQILAESTLGKGATFTIKLPIKCEIQNDEEEEKDSEENEKENSVICG